LDIVLKSACTYSVFEYTLFEDNGGQGMTVVGRTSLTHILLVNFSEGKVNSGLGNEMGLGVGEKRKPALSGVRGDGLKVGMCLDVPGRGVDGGELVLIKGYELKESGNWFLKRSHV
jgi:hypothetical protein